jgi:ribosomal protein S18 acetylase RimI-like enzyme
VAQRKENAGKAAKTGGAVDSLRSAVELRAAVASDFEFAFRVYRETMRIYSSRYITWDDEKQRKNLLHQWEQAEVSVTCLDGTDVGWVAIEKSAESWMIGHLYIGSQFQKRGIGTELLRRFIEEAHNAAKPLDLAVLKNNPAKRLYERVGFVVVDEDAAKYYMRRPHGF